MHLKHKAPANVYNSGIITRLAASSCDRTVLRVSEEGYMQLSQRRIQFGSYFIASCISANMVMV